MLNELCDELDKRVAAGQGVAPANAPRILISGNPMAIPNWKLHHIVETAGAVVVCEESCTGTRFFSDLVKPTKKNLDEQLKAIADRCMNIHCACFTPNDERPDDVVRLAKEYQADGVIHYNLHSAIPMPMRPLKWKNVWRRKGFRCCESETDYSDEDAGQLRTRIEAFLEMIRK